MKASWIFAAALALASAPAAAADLPVKTRGYAPPAAPAFTWTGCYIGVQAGGGVLSDTAVEIESTDNSRGNGAIVGGQLGCNYQIGMFVLGVEADGFWSSIRNENVFSDSDFFASNRTKNKHDFDIAARFGIAFDRALIYGKAGWAWGKFDFEELDIRTDPGSDFFSSKASATLNGVLIGAGAEYALTQNWTTKFEYNYLNFTSKNVNFIVACDDNSSCDNNSRSVSADKHVFKLGINYKLF
jgi:outer membrane immunogenic protein